MNNKKGKGRTYVVTEKDKKEKEREIKPKLFQQFMLFAPFFSQLRFRSYCLKLFFFDRKIVSHAITHLHILLYLVTQFTSLF